MNFWPSRNFLDCLGWTLLHFLWQGLFIAALLVVALRLLRRRSANLRYLAGCLALLLMAVAPVATFCSLSRTDVVPAPKFIIRSTPVTDNAIEITPPSSAPELISPTVTRAPVVKRDYSELLEAALPWLVAAWSLGVLALSCRLVAGWLLVQKLRRTANAVLAGALQAKLKELAGRIGVSRPLRLLQSALVEVPTVIGWLRPVILLPASCLTGLTPAQLESILAHELAHIRRHDYLVNLLQNLVETLLFYHPAVWWVSRRIRQEREHCCDDLAVKICGDAIEYARALATLEELRPAPAQLVLAAGGAPLLERIRRLAGQPERSAVRPAWPVAGVVAVLLLALLAAGLRNNPASAEPAAASSATNQSANTSAPTNAVDYISTNGVITRTTPNQAYFTRVLKILPVATNAGVQFGASGGLQAVPAGSNAVAPVRQSSFTSHLKKLSPATNTPAQPDHSRLPQIHILTKLAEMDASLLGSNTISSFLGDEGSQLGTNLSATFKFTEYYAVQPTNPASSYYDLFLHSNSYVAPLSAVLSGDRFSATIKKLEQKNGVDILTAPEVTTEMGREAQIQAVDITNLVLGGSTLNNTSGPRVLTNVFFGPMVDLIPHLASDGHTVQLTVTCTITEFVGYEDPATVTDKNGKRMPKGWAIPRVRVRQFTADVMVGNGQTLVLGGAPTPLSTISHVKDKVPVLGDIPLLGRLFRSSKTTTNTIQTALMLFITPKLINPDGTPYHFSEKTPVAKLVQDGKLLYEDGKLSAAEAKLQQAMEEDPASVAAWQYLQLIKEKRLADSTRRSELHSVVAIPLPIDWDSSAKPSPRPNPFNRRTQILSPNQQAILAKLHNIRVPVIEYHNLLLSEVINQLASLAKSLDPEKTGINFFISHEAINAAGAAPGVIDPATGLPVAPLPTDSAAEAGSASITISPALKDVRLADVMDAITKTADTPIKYSILDYAVVFSLRNTNEAPPLEIRTFHVNPDAFFGKLGIDLTNDARTGLRFPPPGEADRFHMAVCQLFGSAGVDFDTNTPSKDGKAFVYTSRHSVLTVRATAQDLEKIVTVLDLINPDGKPYHSAVAAPPDEPRKEQLTVSPGFSNRTNLIYTSKGRQAILTKLKDIVVPEVEYNNLPLSEVINHLSRVAKSLDPKKTGINFFLSAESPEAGSAAPGTVDPATGLPVAALPIDRSAELRSVSITINPALKAVHLSDLLDAITKTADKPIKYAVLDYAVVFSLRGPETVPLEIRTYHIDPKKFSEMLDATFEGKKPSDSDTNFQPGITKPAQGLSFGDTRREAREAREQREASVRRFFAAAGVDFRTNNAANVGKAFAWNDRKGVLTVRATAQDLDLIGAVIETLNLQPLQINLKVKFVEITHDTDSRAMGFNWGNMPIGIYQLANVAGPHPAIGKPFAIDNASNRPVPFAGGTNVSNAPMIGSLSGILSGPQYKVALEALEHNTNAHALSSMDVTTLSRRKAQIQSGGSQTNDSEHFSLGPTIDVVPIVSKDEFYLDLNIVATISELTGYDAAGKIKTDMEGKPTGSGFPHYKLRQTTSEATVMDGQTYVFSTAIPDPAATATNAPGKKAATAQLPYKNMMIFVTPTIINPDGTRYHTEKQMAEAIRQSLQGVTVPTNK